MPKYRVLATSYINNSIVQEGAVVEYDGAPGSNLEPIEPARFDGKKPRKGAATEPDPQLALVLPVD